MRSTEFVVAAATALAFISTGSAASAAVPPLPSAAQVEALCPGQGGNILAFGTTREAMGADALAEAHKRAQAAGFEKAVPQFTSWSSRLIGVEYALDVPGGDALGDWGDEFGQAMKAAGWVFSEDPFSFMAAARYEKEVPGASGVRILALELGLHSMRRGITVLCADSELQLEDKNERDGVLAPGSPRPVAPQPQPPLDEFIARLDCEDPGLLADFARAQDLDDVGILVEARLSPAELHSDADYQGRLAKWLRWRLLHSGAVDEVGIWDIEQAVREQVPPDFDGGFVAMVGVLEAVMNADKAKDPTGLCNAYRDAVRVIANQAADEARREAALAAAYEAEAERLGIALD